MELSPKSTSFFYNFFLAPEFRIWRYITISLLLLCVAINDGIGLIVYQGSGRMKEHFVILYILSLFLRYILTIYVVRFLLYPRYQLHKKYALFLIISSIWIFSMVLVEVGVSSFLISYFEIPIQPHKEINHNFIITLDIISFFIIQMIVCIALLTPRFLEKWTLQRKQLVRIENQHLNTHLSQLKELLNPDFLFNILHKITYLEKTDTERASEMVIKLSQLLRYQLYECQKEKVFLSSEIRFINNYLELEKLYYTDFTYDILSPDSLQPILVPPLLFVTLIQEILEENKHLYRIKHLNLQFLYNENQIIFICSANQYGNFLQKEYDSFRKRLSLLFKDNYVLEVRKSEASIYLEIKN